MELVLGMCITSLLVMSFYTVLHSSIDITGKSNDKDDMLLNGRYALSYIKEEINRGDKIIDMANFPDLKMEYPNNIGFVILDIEFNEGEDRYNYSTYYLKEDALIRIASNRTNAKYPRAAFFGGHNELCNGVEEIIGFSYNPEKNIMSIGIRFKNKYETKDFKTNMYLNCPMVLDSGGEDE